MTVNWAADLGGQPSVRLKIAEQSEGREFDRPRSDAVDFRWAEFGLDLHE